MMIEIEGTIVSTEILTARFRCDLRRCRGLCCVEGSAGAPLEPAEAEALEVTFENYRPWLTPEGIEAIETQGFMTVDAEGDYVTPLIGDAACAYSFEEHGITFCAIEKAFREGKTTLNKPLSCHLYPIRVIRFSNGTTGLNYHRWSLCTPAVTCGTQENTPLYRTLREPIIRAFGEEFFRTLEAAAEYMEVDAGARP